jgi:hypothetical protein
LISGESDAPICDTDPMRRLVTAAVAALVLLLATPAAPVAAAPSGPAAHPVTACTATDHRLIGLSGLIVTRTGFVSISDSNVDKSAIRVFFLDRHCRYQRSISYPTSAYDPEDVALGRDGTIYVADIGDNASERSSIAVWRIAPSSTRPHIYRYRYPDRAHDAEAMLLASDDTPIFVTKDVGRSNVYVPARKADPSGRPVPLKQVGTFSPQVTGTSNPFGMIGNLVVTGGANSADRTRVALRTYSDAYEWRVPHGDVVAAITSTKPAVIPLPDEPQGEAIAFDPAGTHLYTVSDRETHPVATKILEYPDPVPHPSSKPSASAHASMTPRAEPTTVRHQMVYPMLALGLAGVALIGAGVIGLLRRRHPS